MQADFLDAHQRHWEEAERLFQPPCNRSRGSMHPVITNQSKKIWEHTFPQGPSGIPSERLPPRHLESWDGIRGDLEHLGIIITRQDGRIDMPAIYRVGYGLGRQGGVTPRR